MLISWKWIFLAVTRSSCKIAAHRPFSERSIAWRQVPIAESPRSAIGVDRCTPVCQRSGSENASGAQVSRNRARNRYTQAGSVLQRSGIDRSFLPCDPVRGTARGNRCQRSGCCFGLIKWIVGLAAGLIWRTMNWPALGASCLESFMTRWDYAA